MVKASYKDFELSIIAKNKLEKNINIERLNRLLELLMKRQEPIAKFMNLTRQLLYLLKKRKLPLMLYKNLQNY